MATFQDTQGFDALDLELDDVLPRPSSGLTWLLVGLALLGIALGTLGTTFDVGTLKVLAGLLCLPGLVSLVLAVRRDRLGLPA